MYRIMTFFSTLFVILLCLWSTSALPISPATDIHNETDTLNTDNITISNHTDDSFSLKDYQDAYQWLNRYGYVQQVPTAYKS